MSKFFPSWQKAIGTVVLTAAGVLIYKAVDKWFRVEQKLPNPNMKKAV